MAPQAKHGYKCSLFATRGAVGGKGDGVAKCADSLFDAYGTSATGTAGMKVSPVSMPLP